MLRISIVSYYKLKTKVRKMSNMNINTFAIRFLRGEFLASGVKTQIEAGWHDWFCRDTSLANKTRALGKKVLQLMKSDKIDADTQYVWFKNNFQGPLVAGNWKDVKAFFGGK